MGSTLAFPFMLPDAGKDEEVSLESTLNQKRKFLDLNYYKDESRTIDLM